MQRAGMKCSSFTAMMRDCGWPDNFDNTKHRDNSPNIWPQLLHSPDPPISRTEQVVLIFHAFSVFATLSPPLWPLVYSSSHKSPFLFHSCCSCFLGGSCSARQNAEHSSGALASSQHSHLSVPPRHRSCLAFSSYSISFRCPSPPFLLSSFLSFSLFPFSFPLSFSLTVVVDWVSECLWQLCVVCNRAERLVWIQRWENLFMWEMHRWRQVSRRCGLSLAVIPHSGPDRRSEMAKYARRSPQIPKLHPTIQPMCACVYSDLTEWFCVRMCVCEVCACVSGMAWLITFPCHRLGPESITTERQRGKSLPAILFLSHPSDLFLFLIC